MMAASKNLSENTVIYKLFCTNSDGNCNLVSHENLEIISEDYLSKISGFLLRYVWQNDSFNLRVVDSVTTGKTRTIFNHTQSILIYI